MASSSFETAAFSSLGELLKHLRKRKGLKQGDLEEQIGLDQSTISRAENNQLNPTDETLLKLASAYEIDIEKLRGMIASIPKASIAASTLNLGMLHGIASAPLITMLMDGDQRNIRITSTVGENGLNWWEPGEQPGSERLAQNSNAQALFAGSLQRVLRDADLDLIVASEEMFKDETGPAGRLLRCAQISNSYSMIHLLELRPKQGEALSIVSQPPAKPIKLLYPHGTIGMRYKDILINESELKGKLDPQYYTLDQPHNHVPEPIENCFKTGDHFCVLSWPPRSSSLKKEAKRRKHWNVSQFDMGKVLNHYSTRVPACSVDLLLAANSARIVEWIQTGEYANFFDDLIRYTRSFSADRLRQDSLVVDQVSRYLGIDDKEECFQELLLIDYNVMFYPEFLKFLDAVRNKRAI